MSQRGRKSGTTDGQTEPREEDSRKIPVSDLQGKFVHIKVGDPSWGIAALDRENMDTLSREMKKIEDQITQILDDHGIECLVWVTHCFVDIDIIEARRAQDE